MYLYLIYIVHVSFGKSCIYLRVVKYTLNNVHFFDHSSIYSLYFHKAKQISACTIREYICIKGKEQHVMYNLS